VILSSGAMTNRLDGLEEMGLIRRLPDPNDRRGRLVELTPKGRELVDKAVVEHLSNEEDLLSGLSAAERDKLADLLRKLLLSEPFRALDPAGRAAAGDAMSLRSVRRPRSAQRRRGRR
jgi:DNA-binding PadR family transcriptional regulator